MITNTYGYDSNQRTLTVTRPELTIYQRDRNIMKFEAEDGDKLNYIDIEIVYNGTTYESLHFEELTESWFVVDLTSYLQKITPILGGYTGYLNIEVEVEYGGNTETITDSSSTDVEYNIWNGRTLADRHHCCERVVRYYDNNKTSVEVSGYDSGSGMNVVDSIDVTSLSPDAYGTAYETFDGGGIVDAFVRDATSTYQLRYKLCCVPQNAVWLRFTNSDGCKREIAAKMLSVAIKEEDIRYSSEGCERHKAASYNTKLQRTYNIGITDVEYAEFLTDIMFADDVEFAYSYSGTWTTCVCESMTYNEDGGTHNATLKIIVNI